jgi:hypothetical protein
MCLSGDPSYCYKTKRPWIIDYWITDNSSLIYLEFNTTILIQSTWVKGTSWDLKLEGPLDEYYYDWEVINSTKHMSVPTSTLYIKINYTGQLFDYDLEKITLSFNDSVKVKDSVNGFDMIDTGVDFYLKGKEKTLPFGYWFSLYLFAFLYAIFIGVSIALTLLGFSGWIAVDSI